MIIKMIWIGRTKQQDSKNLVDLYLQRLKHYCRLEVTELKETKKNSNITNLKSDEAKLIMQEVKEGDYVILLDERGDQVTSLGFSEFLQKRMNSGVRRIVFIIGGAFGAHERLFQKCDLVLSLSKLTFTHDMARIVMLEQVYRAYTILNGEKYHNE